MKAAKVSIKCDIKSCLVPRTVGNKVRESVCKVLIETIEQRQGQKNDLQCAATNGASVEARTAKKAFISSEQLGVNSFERRFHEVYGPPYIEGRLCVVQNKSSQHRDFPNIVPIRSIRWRC